jgi:hypothetical protein
VPSRLHDIKAIHMREVVCLCFAVVALYLLENQVRAFCTHLWILVDVQDVIAVILCKVCNAAPGEPVGCSLVPAGLLTAESSSFRSALETGQLLAQLPLSCGTYVLKASISYLQNSLNQHRWCAGGGTCALEQ